MKPRVLLADDHTLVLDGYRKLLEGSCDIVGAAEDGRTLLKLAHQLQPDIVTLDISMPHLNGIDAACRLHKELPKIKIIFVTMHADQAYVAEAFKAGATGYLLKRSAGSELVQAIDAVISGHSYITPLIAKGLVQSAVTGRKSSMTPSDMLTPRQREVLQLVAEGNTIKEIAAALKISPKTVEFHKTQLMDQLDLHTTAELTRFALTHRIISS